VAKDEVEAIDLYRKAGEGGDVGGFNNLAWILATSENSAIRNGPNAVFFGEKAVAATNRKKPTNLDTLAAAYAEASQFEKAVKTEQEAIALLKTKAEKNVFRTRLKLYEAKVPYRDKD
jgi:TPR repeat protein